jgi:hypothetical protein
MNLRQQLAEDLGSRIPGCSVGLKFGHGSLEVDKKVFAFTRPDESAAVKLPAARIAGLITDGEIRHLKMGERTMREWVAIPNIAAPQNLALLHEAMTYVASLPKTERRKRPATKAAKKISKKATKTR